MKLRTHRTANGNTFFSVIDMIKILKKTEYASEMRTRFARAHPEFKPLSMRAPGIDRATPMATYDQALFLLAHMKGTDAEIAACLRAYLDEVRANDLAAAAAAANADDEPVNLLPIRESDLRHVVIDNIDFYSVADALVKGYSRTVRYSSQWIRRNAKDIEANGNLRYHMFPGMKGTPTAVGDRDALEFVKFRLDGNDAVNFCRRRAGETADELGQDAMAEAAATGAAAEDDAPVAQETLVVDEPEAATAEVMEQDNHLDSSSDAVDGNDDYVPSHDSPGGASLGDVSHQIPPYVESAPNGLTPEIFASGTRKVIVNGKRFVSAIDILVQLFGYTQKNASTFLNRNFNTIEGEIIYNQFSGERQRPTPCVNVDGALFLTMRVPGKAATTFRRKCFNVLAKYFAGDPKLATEAAANAENISDEARDFLIGDDDRSNRTTTAVKRKADETEVHQLETAITLDRLRWKRAKQQVSEAKEFYDMLFDSSNTKEQIAFQDWKLRVFADAQQRTGNQLALGNGSAAGPANAIAPAANNAAAPVPNNTTTEISIPLMCQALNIPYTSRVSQKASAIGRKMAQLYRERYGDDVVFHKRRVLHQGKPIYENAYFERDADLMKRAILFVLNADNGADS